MSESGNENLKRLSAEEKEEIIKALNFNQKPKNARQKKDRELLCIHICFFVKNQNHLFQRQLSPSWNT